MSQKRGYVDLPKPGTLQRTVIDIMALTGDAADNVPGVRGIGAKTAAALINHFGTLDALMLSAMTGYTNQVLTPRIARMVVAQMGQALLSRRLVVLLPIRGGDYR